MWCLTWCIQPSLPVNVLHCFGVLEVGAEVALEVVSGECLELEILQVSLQEGFKLGSPPDQALRSMQSMAPTRANAASVNIQSHEL